MRLLKTNKCGWGLKIDADNPFHYLIEELESSQYNCIIRMLDPLEALQLKSHLTALSKLLWTKSGGLACYILDV